MILPFDVRFRVSFRIAAVEGSFKDDKGSPKVINLLFFLFMDPQIRSALYRVLSLLLLLLW